MAASRAVGEAAAGVDAAAAAGAVVVVAAGAAVAAGVATGAGAVAGVVSGFRLVCVSDEGLAASAATDGGLRVIIVRSKSCAVACAGASLKYFNLCLPISITSLFCRKCFLMGLPLTSVPLVEFRSSMNESFRMVMIAACSPDTARLSTWISLCGLRPSVVRSLLSEISFSTVPSTLTISVAMVLTLRNYFQMRWYRRTVRMRHTVKPLFYDCPSLKLCKP